ncbi:hypothetical protein PIB30_116633 [Stylosanthes scabra]|uniref:Transposase MuDR plant domain-containing protein n=1 Tax=Stylosanthes scabra TaxID=79078 RepID=A0ABU6V6L4_9FABA|nr:hypothetical protein [Stylosanthes scabra]
MMTFAELQHDLCECIDRHVLKSVNRILYRMPVQLFAEAIYFDTMAIVDEASMRQMMQCYQQTRMHVPAMELFVDFDRLSEVEEDPEIDNEKQTVLQENLTDSEDELEATYDVDGEDEDDEEVRVIVALQGSSNQPVNEGVGGVPPFTQAASAPTINQHPLGVPSFMFAVDFAGLNAPEFAERENMAVAVPEDGEFMVGMEYSSRKAVISAIKTYHLNRGVDYAVHESEPQTFLAKCKSFGEGCDRLIRTSFVQRRSCWVIRRYNGKHTCAIGAISQDHSKLDSDTIAESIRPLVESDPSLKFRTIIAEVQSRFNYTISYRKAWMAKQKSIEKIYGSWEGSYETLPQWMTVMCQKIPGSTVKIETLPAYRGDEVAVGVRVLHIIFWSFYPCIRAFRHCKPLVQVDGTHLYGKYKGVLMVAVTQDENQNIVPVAFAIVEGETADA